MGEGRLVFLAEHPLCCRCQEADIVEPATVVDHVVPHRGDQKLFWDRSNWQAICAPHHNRDKQREEARGYRVGVRLDGRPVAIPKSIALACAAVRAGLEPEGS